ncbi:MAG: energy transducer TonB [Bryobacterales bacterium]|nr:energy transducer TonB [Bryobacterales bacterium]
MNSNYTLLRSVSAAALVTLSFAAMCRAAEEPVRIPQPTAMSNATNKVAPSYPPVARQLRLTGDVEVDVTIDEDGRVQDAKVVRGNAVFSAATVDAVKKWSFKPIQVQGKAQKVLTTLTFSFRP